MSQNVNKATVIWVVYDHPSDYPEDYVARMWLNGVATETCIVNKSVWAIRVIIGHNYPLLRCLPRIPEDDPCVVECWL
jgi:hypothetical protein